MQHAHRERVDHNIGIGIVPGWRFEHGDFGLRLGEGVETHKTRAGLSDLFKGVDNTELRVVNWGVIGYAERGAQTLVAGEYRRVCGVHQRNGNGHLTRVREGYVHGFSGAACGEQFARTRAAWGYEIQEDGGCSTRNARDGCALSIEHGHIATALRFPNEERVVDTFVRIRVVRAHGARHSRPLLLRNPRRAHVFVDRKDANHAGQVPAIARVIDDAVPDPHLRKRVLDIYPCSLLRIG